MGQSFSFLILGEGPPSPSDILMLGLGSPSAVGSPVIVGSSVPCPGCYFDSSVLLEAIFPVAYPFLGPVKMQTH